MKQSHRLKSADLRAFFRDSSLLSRYVVLRRTLRAVWNAIDILHVRKSRSYLHGLLFDLKGGIYSTEGLDFQIPSDQFPRSYRSRLYFDVYEHPERSLVHKWLSPSAAVLELGGCIGVVSCVVNQVLDRPRDHVVVEANPTLIGILTANRDRNHCGFRIENCVVSKKPTAGIRIGRVMTANRTEPGSGEWVGVETQTFEALQEKHQVRFDTLILDIEGGEFEFLRENAGSLGQVRLVILELHRNILSASQVDVCQSLLRAAGLTLVDEWAETEVWARADD